MKWPDRLLASALLLVAQNLAANNAYQRVSWDFDLPERISPASFSVCSQHNCQTRTRAALEPEQWEQIVALFAPPADSAAAEREQIARAIGRMEQLVADFANTHHDKAGDFNGFTQPGSQLDCVDESINTTTYLTLFEQKGLLRWHRVLDRTVRHPWILDFHWTAVIEDRTTGVRYAVDSWYLDNGQPPYIQQLEDWQVKRRFPKQTNAPDT